MSFSSNVNIDALFPSYLTEANKNRLRTGLQQFFNQENLDLYNSFFIGKEEAPKIVLQADIFNSISAVDWNDELAGFENGFIPAMFLSNSCDIANEADINDKQVLFAPVISLKEYFQDLSEAGFGEEKLKSFKGQLKKQDFANIFYIPANPINQEEYLVFFDKVTWLPRRVMSTIIEKLHDERFISLSLVGHYLFLVKLSYFLCRTPEEVDGRV